ncbi:MAG: molybdopterin molybdotransferase MoeA [Flavobacteriaceae bacterium]
MITFDEAFKEVLRHPLELGVETIPLAHGMKRILAEDILADRDFPPFDRATKDGIAISYSAIENGLKTFKIEGVLSAGMPQKTLTIDTNCLEIMTGAVLPKKADTVIMYEEVTLIDGIASIETTPKKRQNIHAKGSDEKKGTVLLNAGIRIDTAEIGILASVGKTEVVVKKIPKITVISTGNELVEVAETPLPHQIRKSNTISLAAALSKEGIGSQLVHFADTKKEIEQSLGKALQANDVLLLSGGVSKGKFDFIPEVMETLGVKKIFHRVAQRPGKPFWFGVHLDMRTLIFSFPGNPVSTFANYHIYFLPWLYKTWGLPYEEKVVILQEEIRVKLPLTRFVLVKTYDQDGCLKAQIIGGNGSGDLISLAKSDGFVCLRPREESYKKGEMVPFISTR